MAEQPTTGILPKPEAKPLISSPDLVNPAKPEVAAPPPNPATIDAANRFMNGFKMANGRLPSLYDIAANSSNAWQDLPSEVKALVEQQVRERIEQETKERQAREIAEKEKQLEAAPSHAAHFISGYKQAFGAPPSVAELEQGYVANEAWLRLSEPARQEVLRQLRGLTQK